MWAFCSQIELSARTKFLGVTQICVFLGSWSGNSQGFTIVKTFENLDNCWDRHDSEKKICRNSGELRLDEDYPVITLVRVSNGIIVFRTKPVQTATPSNESSNHIGGPGHRANIVPNRKKEFFPRARSRLRGRARSQCADDAPHTWQSRIISEPVRRSRPGLGCSSQDNTLSRDRARYV